MAKNLLPKKVTFAGLKKENALLKSTLDAEIANYKKHFETQKQKIDELCDLVARREAEILAMAKTDEWQHKRIGQLEAIVKSLETLQDNTDRATLERIKRLEADLAKAAEAKNLDVQELREQLLSYQQHSERLAEKGRAALEFIRTHCFCS